MGGRSERRESAFNLFHRAAENGHGRAECGELLGDGEADPAAAAGYKGVLIVKKSGLKNRIHRTAAS
jgi:hypothetical protein